MNELGATPEMLKSADFDLDYLNKVLVPSSSFAKAELVASGLSDSPLAAKNIMSQKDKQPSEVDGEKAEKDPSTTGLQVPVDKGLFRRKLNIIVPNDIEAGEKAEEAAASGDESKAPKQGMTFAQKLLSMVGLQQNASVRPLNKAKSIKRDQSFIEHRQTILQKWKDNIKNKMPKQKSTLSEDEKETEVSCY